MKYLYLALSSIILAYIIIVLFTYLYQRKLLYHPSENNYTGDEIQFEYKEVFIEVDKDIKLKSWFLEKDVKKYKTILYFHGNAGDLTNRVHKLNELYKFFSVGLPGLPLNPLHDIIRIFTSNLNNSLSLCTLLVKSPALP